MSIYKTQLNTRHSIQFTLINDKQIGFLKGYKTFDHILLIDTIIHEIVHKCKQRLFVAFIDLKKAYDKVNTHALLCKLRSKGFSGKFQKYNRSHAY